MKSLFSGIFVASGAAKLTAGALGYTQRLLSASVKSPHVKSRRSGEMLRLASPEVTVVRDTVLTHEFIAVPEPIPTPVTPPAHQPTELVLPETPAVVAEPADAKSALRNFKIKRTKSEVGFVYWILEGFGRYKCFVLCDTWEEAITQAKKKLAETDSPDVSPALSMNALA